MSTNDNDTLARLLKAREPKGKKAPVEIPKMSEKRKKQVKEDKKTSALDKEFYAEIWAAGPHVCEECAKKLGKEPLTLFFHHLFEKRNYSELRYTPENIMILCPDCHTQAESDLDKVPKVKLRRAQAEKLLLT